MHTWLLFSPEKTIVATQAEEQNVVTHVAYPQKYVY